MSLSTLLQSRVNELEMSISDLARRSGVSRATVIRILGGKDEHYSVSNLQAVLSALGMKMDLLATPAKGFKDAIATQKAKRLIAGIIMMGRRLVMASGSPCRIASMFLSTNRIFNSTQVRIIPRQSAAADFAWQRHRDCFQTIGAPGQLSTATALDWRTPAKCMYSTELVSCFRARLLGNGKLSVFKRRSLASPSRRP